MDLSIIDRIVPATGIRAGENVLVHFWGEDENLPIARAFMQAAAKLGTSPVLLQQSRTQNRALFTAAADRAFDGRYFEAFAHFDTVLDVFTYQPIVPGGPLPPEALNRYRAYISRLFGALMKSKKFLQLRMPTAANAAESGLNPDDFIARLERAYSVDFTALQNDCAEKVNELKSFQRLTLKTGENCALHFIFADRSWFIDAGDGDWPCGEVYIAPLEENTHGSICFPRLYVEDAGIFEKITLFVSSGRVIGSSDPAFNAWLASQPSENTIVCELGFGMNKNIDSLCGYTVLDEKMAGTFHIALGNNTMFGGKNDARMHLDLVHSGSFELLSQP